MNQIATLSVGTVHNALWDLGFDRADTNVTTEALAEHLAATVDAITFALGQLKLRSQARDIDRKGVRVWVPFSGAQIAP